MVLFTVLSFAGIDADDEVDDDIREERAHEGAMILEQALKRRQGLVEPPMGTIRSHRRFSEDSSTGSVSVPATPPFSSSSFHESNGADDNL